MNKKYFYLNTQKENNKFLQNNWSGIYGNLTPKGIILHDGASGMNATAETVASRTVKAMSNNDDYPNYHNVIDASGKCYSVVREDKCAYHSGDALGNKNYLSVEIAPTLVQGNFKNSEEKTTYYKAWKNACKLVADYCVKYNLSTDRITQHRDFNATACPYTMMKYFGSYEKALSETRKEVGKNMKIINGEIPHKFQNRTVEEFLNDNNNKQYFEFTGDNIEYIKVNEETFKYQSKNIVRNLKTNNNSMFIMKSLKDTPIYRDKYLTDRSGTFKKGTFKISNYSDKI